VYSKITNVKYLYASFISDVFFQFHFERYCKCGQIVRDITRALNLKIAVLLLTCKNSVLCLYLFLVIYNSAFVFSNRGSTYSFLFYYACSKFDSHVLTLNLIKGSTTQWIKRYSDTNSIFDYMFTIIPSILLF